MQFISILIVLFSLSTYAGEIALTFDDAPRRDANLYSGVQRTQKLIDVLGKYKIQTVFFVNTDKFPNSQGSERVASYSKSGHLIANHTHSHPRLRETPTNIFLQDLDKADEVLKDIPTFKRWFRFPFLGEGSTLEVRDQVRQHLNEKGYRNGYVTVDNYDYFIDDLVQNALEKGQKVNLDRACNMLVDLMWDGIKYYDDLAQKYLGTVRHVLLMHENDIEAHCLEKLISHIHKKGWKIISPKVAYDDPIFASEPDTLYLSQGRIAAMVHAKTGLKFQSKWESEKALKAEFKKRRIVEKL